MAFAAFIGLAVPPRARLAVAGMAVNLGIGATSGVPLGGTQAYAWQQSKG
jgi:hypothetical protein